MQHKSQGMERVIQTHLSCSIPLADDFRVGDALDFHGRDTLAVAERIDGHCLQKGLMWEGQAASLTIRLEIGHADVELAIDGITNANQDALIQMVRRMLGLTQRIEDFESIYRTHPQLGLLIARQPGLRVPLSATPFEALTWAITGQQISIGAAISLRRKFIQLTGVKDSSGLACYPDAGKVANLSETELRQAGFSQTKAQTLIMLSREVAANRLPLKAWMTTMPVEEIHKQLLSLRGIGPWTVNYALLRGFGWLDGSLHGDAAVRRKLQLLLSSTEKVTESFTERRLAEFSPWRALVAAHLWTIPSEFLPVVK